jgi:hypothetical protein
MKTKHNTPKPADLKKEERSQINNLTLQTGDSHKEGNHRQQSRDDLNQQESKKRQGKASLLL